MAITENQLDEWVRGHSRDAQGLIVELVWRLVAASCPKPKERRFPLGDSVGQHGPDGVLNVALGLDPFVPDGRSFWEIGTGDNAGDKATDDYRDLTGATPDEVRKDATFVFVTPRSGRTDWKGTWKDDAQLAWLKDRNEKEDWKEVRVIDGTRLIDWLRSFPSVDQWLAHKILGVPHKDVETAEQRWGLTRSIGEPPPLIPQVFLANRDEACAKLKELFDDKAVQLKLETHYPDQVGYFVAAYLSSLDAEERADAEGRCLLISGEDAWHAMARQKERHVLVAEASLDLSGDAGTRLIQIARRQRHAVVFGGPRGGIPDPASTLLLSPRSHQIKEALEKAGYKEERARVLTQKSGENLGSLLRLLQNLSLMPAWAEGTQAADLEIAALLGSWSEKSEADRTVVEGISGKFYGEWVERMREVALRPGAPLIHRDGVWKFIARYEGWYALGPRLFDEHLRRLMDWSLRVFRERDPKFDLPPDQHFTASIHGKVLRHSSALRRGLAEGLALLGSHSQALMSASLGMAERTAIMSVRQILKDADWVLWASLNDYLPLFAEAAPAEFLGAVTNALDATPCPFDSVFAQEGDGVTGGNYSTGLLWALETLAWDPAYLSRVIVVLGQLAGRDPGGKWSNRPANSLTTILLPWSPQTCATIPEKRAAVKLLIAQHPNAGWNLLLSLLPQSHQMTTGSHKPEWRAIIPDDWSRTITRGEYWEQVTAYSELTIDMANNDVSRFAAIIQRLDDFPLPAYERILSHLCSDEIIGLAEPDRLRLWSALVDIISKHRKFKDAQWAMLPERVDKIETVANGLAPHAATYRHQRLFGEQEYKLYTEGDDYEEKSREVEKRRQAAIREIFDAGGLTEVLRFAELVESPWRVGISFGFVAALECDQQILPLLLSTEKKSLNRFAGGYVWSRYKSKSWAWVDDQDKSNWSVEEIAQFLAYLPFASNTWDRAVSLLADHENEYWVRANANPHEEEAHVEFAVDQLLKFGRPFAAINCLQGMRYQKKRPNSEQVIKVLLAAVNSTEDRIATSAHEITELIEFLQKDHSLSADEVGKVEWAYLPLLDRISGKYPTRLHQRLADDPNFFCEVIRLVYRPKDSPAPIDEPTEQDRKIASNAFRLLHDWRIPPGNKLDGEFDGGALCAWMETMKRVSAETGHLNVALSTAGHALFYSPPDPDGLWIHRAVAKELNSKDSEDARNGFRNEVYNSRGAHWVDPTGKPERELADKYRTQANAVDSAGYFRFAATLRELADSYDREAEAIVARERNVH